ncbi:MAG: hypothetical protein P8Z37_17115, partial [Acidobacteriota bacterium]
GSKEKDITQEPKRGTTPDWLKSSNSLDIESRASAKCLRHFAGHSSSHSPRYGGGLMRKAA